MSNIIVMSGPSGSGKSTLISKLQEKYSNIVFSVSHTTRAPREGEKNGVNYHFVDEDSFKAMIEKDEFAEWAGVHGKYYGTSWAEIETKSSGDNVLILDIDVQGVANIKKRLKDAVYVFIIPPSLEVLKERLMGREQRYDEEIRLRLDTAVKEIEQYKMYEYIIVNGDLDTAVEDLNGVFRAYSTRTGVREDLIHRILNNGR